VTLVPVLEVGGTHVSAATVDDGSWAVSQLRRLPVDGAGSAQSILDSFVAAGAALGVAADVVWGVAMPDPFDYDRGVATFRDVGKFESLYGVDVGAALRERLPQQPADVVFLNDADAFILGEWTAGAAHGHRRCVGITLGTGLGTGWIVDGRVTTTEPGVPELGRARTLTVDGTGLEEIVSARGIRRAFAARGGDSDADVAAIAERVRDGDDVATGALDAVFDALGRGLGPSLRAFAADVVVIGGSIAGSWDLMEPAFWRGLDWPDGPRVVVAAHTDEAALRGAARAVSAGPDSLPRSPAIRPASADHQAG
jgi:glucokinase